jgi:N-acetylglutamate synthase-like GNAT family acetyltransferase
MIRLANEHDVPRLLDMGLTFQREHYCDTLPENKEQLESTIRTLISNTDARIIVWDTGAGADGMIAFMVNAHMFSGERAALELVWWVEPAVRGVVGLRLLRAAENAARDMGAARMVMISPNERVSRMYSLLGYAEVERVFHRGL